MKTLITIASEQAWHQIITIAHLKPEKLVILHSSNAKLSEEPAKRLSDFCIKCEGMKPENIILAPVKDHILFDLKSLDLGINDDDEVYVNITGGTKQMSICLFLFSFFAKYKMLYYNHDFALQYYIVENNSIKASESEFLDPSKTNKYDPLDILILHKGENIIADEGYVYNSKSKIAKLAINKKIGLQLEKATMQYFFKKNIRFRHSVALKSENSEQPNEDIDVLVNYNGALWLVECKMQKERNFKESLKSKLLNQPWKIKKGDILDSFVKDLMKYMSNNKFMQYKGDLFSAKKISGLYAKVLWITTIQIPELEVDFFNAENVQYVDCAFFKTALENGHQQDVLSFETESRLSKIFK